MDQTRAESTRATAANGTSKNRRNGKRNPDRRRQPDPVATDPLLSRGRPGNLEAERNVLGSILLKPDVCDDVALLVRPEDFADEARLLSQ